MNSSLRLMTIRGIDIKLHITFPLILIYAAFQFGFLAGGGWEGALFGVISISLLFALVTLHELGHSVAAQYYGVPVKQIVLLPIGGVAQLQRMPRNPWQELVIAVAGPAVNVVMAILMWLFALAFGFSLATSPLQLLIGGFTLSFAAIFGYIFFYNIILAVFNLIPAFPMDGGRILRALLALRLPYGRATQIAVSIGRGLAIIFGLYALFNGQIFLILIAFFIFTGATQEGQVVEQYERLRGITVQQAYTSQAIVISPYDTLQRAVMLRLMGWQADFPVFYNGELVGFLTENDLMQAMAQRGPATLVQEIMKRDITPVSLHNEIFDVQERMRDEQMRALPVMEGARFLGLVTYDHIRSLLRTLAARPDWYRTRSVEA